MSPDTGGRRLIDLLRPRANRGQAIAGALLAVVGFAAAIQVQMTHSGDPYATARRGDLVAILEGLSQSAARLELEIADREAQLESLRTNADRSRVALTQAREQADVLGVLAGTLPATGPGIRVTISGAGRRLGASTLLNAVEELRDAGAEAIEIGGRARVVASTDLVDAAGGILVDGTFVRPPYLIEAIGDPHTLAAAMAFRGGLVDEVGSLGGEASVAERGSVEIESLHRPQSPRYSQPASGEPGG